MMRRASMRDIYSDHDSFGFGPMHTAIFHVVAPENPTYEQKQQFDNFCKATRTIRSPQLGLHVWQVNFQRLPGDLGRLIDACERHAIPYRILALSEEPQWIRWNPAADPAGFE